MAILISLGLSLALTLLLEVPIALLQKIPLKLAVAVNVITNPTVVILYHWAKYFELPIVPVLAILELLAVLCEGWLYKGHHNRPYLFALCINAFSFGMGLLI